MILVASAVIIVELFALIFTTTTTTNNTSMLQLPNGNGIVELTARGSGMAVAQLSVCYHTDEQQQLTDTSTAAEKEASPFECDLKIQDGGIDKSMVRLCCR